ncbi:CTAG modification methylase [Natronomonas pharaonis DSM 2160]|uniref:Type II methyltransferase n=1 Tax=Natronomonas pharaonis (strain ATCC 35678 / DSM 2160 / CIP 103997 / JCM 8858 / NBRC 14720 / NCIMB 2260 / Gabara) TaxID=348780 RepID=Q3IUF9_NATPD|nr:site-specific DNA-methyltransferase [Natronomonas pharaonis]CAI48221.1 CTAG modification methylase [Natronomonas pharaonis DSM 2160]
MKTTHRIVAGDARGLEELDDDAVELVVTSPPYPMVELWDDLFADLDGTVASLLSDGDGDAAFEAMHEQLDAVWRELSRVLVDGGIACVNVGDATRTLGDGFRVYQNHARIIEAFESLGFDPLPEVLWRKPANSTAKFMGSGMVPPNAYVTLEHEYILVFRNGGRRAFEPNADRRYEAAYFWEERNQWFSDVWTDVRGETQTLDNEDLRDRSAAYPFEIPYRLINMYSTYGDTVLDPFWGTGTTTLAAMVAGRNSVGYELDDGLVEAFDDRAADVPALSRRVTDERLDEHRAFIDRRRSTGESFEYRADNYDFPVRTKQERGIQLYTAEAVTETDSGYRVRHEPKTE